MPPYKTLEEVNEEKEVLLKSLLESLCRYDPKLSTPRFKEKYIKISKKNTARIEISVHPSYDRNKAPSFSTRRFIKNEYGGYEIAQIGPHIFGLDSVSKLIEVIEYFFGLPEVIKTKKKEKDDIDIILQNIICRRMEEKYSPTNIYNLAKNENDSCSAKMIYVDVKVQKNKIEIEYPTLCGIRSKLFKFSPESPDFDPNKVIDNIIEIDIEMEKIQHDISSRINYITHKGGYFE